MQGGRSGLRQSPRLLDTWPTEPSPTRVALNQGQSLSSSSGCLTSGWTPGRGCQKQDTLTDPGLASVTSRTVARLLAQSRVLADGVRRQP